MSNAWHIGGNVGTTPANNFIGTSDDKPLELGVNNSRALRLQPDISPANAPNLIGGSPGMCHEQYAARHRRVVAAVDGFVFRAGRDEFLPRTM